MVGFTRQARKISIRYTVGTLFLIATTLTALVAITLQFHFGKQASQEQLLSKLIMASAAISEYVNEMELSAASNTRLLKAISMADSDKFSQQEIRDLLVEVLRDNPLFYSIYYGKPNDEFYQIINLDSSPVVRQRLQAEDNERWVLRDPLINTPVRLHFF